MFNTKLNKFMPGEKPRVNPEVESLKRNMKEYGSNLQIPVYETPLVHKELKLDGSFDKSLGYITSVKQNPRNSNLYQVKTDDGGETVFNVYVKEK